MSYVKFVSGSDYRFFVRGVMFYYICFWLNLLNGFFMFKRRYVILFFFFVLFVVCSSKLKFIEIDTIIGTSFGGFLFES